MKTVSQAIVILLLAATSLSARVQHHDPPANEKDREDAARLFLGQPLEEVKRILGNAKLDWIEGGFELHIPDRDESAGAFTLDNEHTSVCLFYSKSKQVVTGIQMVFIPSRAAECKLNRSWISASQLQLHDDGSYSVTFIAPQSSDNGKKWTYPQTVGAGLGYAASSNSTAERYPRAECRRTRL
jgi:hypothetical protein